MAMTDYGLPEIPSEFIEPYLQKYLMEIVYEVGCEMLTPQEGRDKLQAIDRFVSMFCGIHAKLATTNIYYKVIILSDEKMLEHCKAHVERRHKLEDDEQE